MNTVNDETGAVAAPVYFILTTACMDVIARERTQFETDGCLE